MKIQIKTGSCRSVVPSFFGTGDWFACPPATHSLLCGPVPNTPRTGTGWRPGGWQPLVWMILPAFLSKRSLMPWGKNETRGLSPLPSILYCLSSHVPLISGFVKDDIKNSWCHPTYWLWNLRPALDISTFNERGFLGSIRSCSVWLLQFFPTPRQDIKIYKTN